MENSVEPRSDEALIIELTEVIREATEIRKNFFQQNPLLAVGVGLGTFAALGGLMYWADRSRGRR